MQQKNLAVNGSSSYDWTQDDEVLLNTCIIGSPGGVLPSAINNQPVPAAYMSRRLAVHQWFRKTTSWKPLWLNSFTGSFTAPPALHCWGRLETINNDTVLTALALRDTATDNNLTADAHFRKIQWNGRWALIAQDNTDILGSVKLAVIPFDEGWISLALDNKPASVSKLNLQGETNYNDWQWQDGKLIIKITKDELVNTAGFLVK